MRTKMKDTRRTKIYNTIHRKSWEAKERIAELHAK